MLWSSAHAFPCRFADKVFGLPPHQCLPGFTGPLGGPCTPCAEGHHKQNSGSSPCTGCEAGKYADHRRSTACLICAPDTFSQPASLGCSKCARYTSSPPGSAVCSCDQKHRGRQCLITIRLPPSPQDRAFLLEVKLAINTSDPVMPPDHEQSIRMQLLDFLSIARPQENLSVSLDINGNLRQKRDGVLQGVRAQAVLISDWDVVSSGRLEMQRDLDEWLGDCCQVLSISVSCGAGHQSLLQDESNQTVSISSLQSCIPCPIGSFKAALDSSPCEPCQGTKTTLFDGATNESFCTCPPGYAEEQQEEGSICLMAGQVSEEGARETSRIASAVIGTAIATVMASTVAATVY